MLEHVGQLVCPLSSTGLGLTAVQHRVRRIHFLTLCCVAITPIGLLEFASAKSLMQIWGAQRLGTSLGWPGQSLVQYSLVQSLASAQSRLCSKRRSPFSPHLLSIFGQRWTSKTMRKDLSTRRWVLQVTVPRRRLIAPDCPFSLTLQSLLSSPQTDLSSTSLKVELPGDWHEFLGICVERVLAEERRYAGEPWMVTGCPEVKASMLVEGEARGGGKVFLSPSALLSFLNLMFTVMPFH